MEDRARAKGKLMDGVALDPRIKQCIGCAAVGLPEPGYSFFACGACLDRLGDVIENAEYILPVDRRSVS